MRDRCVERGARPVEGRGQAGPVAAGPPMKARPSTLICPDVTAGTWIELGVAAAIVCSMHNV